MERTLRALADRHAVTLTGRTAACNPLRLRAALSMPLSLIALVQRPVYLTELAAAYARGILRLKPFAQGNEVIAYLAAKTFLSLNGIKAVAPARESFVAFAGFIAGRVSIRAFHRWLMRCHLSPRPPNLPTNDGSPAPIRRWQLRYAVRLVRTRADAPQGATPPAPLPISTPEHHDDQADPILR